MPRSLLAAALLVVLAGCSPSNAAPVSPVADEPSASPTASLSPSTVPPSASPKAPARLAGIGRQMDAGTYVYDEAVPHVTFELPADWYLDESMPRHFGIRPKDMPVEDTFIVWFDMRLASRDRSCPEEPLAGAGHSQRDMKIGFQTDPRLVATHANGYLLGGLRGSTFDLSLAPTWKRSCPFANGAATAPLFVDADVEGEPAFWGVSGKERIRMIVLDDQHGSNVLITYDSANGQTLDAIEAAVKPVLESLRFDVSDPT